MVIRVFGARGFKPTFGLQWRNEHAKRFLENSGGSIWLCDYLLLHRRLDLRIQR